MSDPINFSKKLVHLSWLEQISATEFLNHFAHYLNKIDDNPNNPLVITKYGKPTCVILSNEFYQGMLKAITHLQQASTSSSDD